MVKVNKTYSSSCYGNQKKYENKTEFNAGSKPTTDSKVANKAKSISQKLESFISACKRFFASLRGRATVEKQVSTAAQVAPKWLAKVREQQKAK